MIHIFFWHAILQKSFKEDFVFLAVNSFFLIDREWSEKFATRFVLTAALVIDDSEGSNFILFIVRILDFILKGVGSMDMSETDWRVERFLEELSIDDDTLARKSGGVYP